MHHDPQVTGYLFEHARDIILVIDADDGWIIGANRAAEAAYRCTREDLLALKIFDLRLEPSISVATQMRVADSHGIQFEALHRRRDGSTFPVEVSSRGETMSGRRCLFSIVRDISERSASWQPVRAGFIARHRASDRGGPWRRIDVESTLGSGSAFRVTLPRG